MVTKYPGAYDSYGQIREVRDTIDEIVAADHNALRGAIFKIERELGINPSGIFTNVAGRLDDAYNNLISHVNGFIPRHTDDQIDASHPKSGSPHFSLNGLTVEDQLKELISYINTPMYSGSSDSFYDGYTLPASYIESAIDEIVRRLGSADGAEGVGFSGTTNPFADGYDLPVSNVGGAIKEVVRKLGLHNATPGASVVGAWPFSTGKYTITGSDIESQIQSIGTVDEEQSKFFEYEFGAHVVSGMNVTRADSTHVSIALGTISVDGRVVDYAGGSLAHTGVGTHEIFAKILSGVVVIQEASSHAEFMAYDSVPLIEFTESGSAFSYSADFRRFGTYTNREFITVGDDGYADFSSLKSATAWIEKNNLTLSYNTPTTIKLITDITVAPGESAISLQEGCIVDGNNHIISWSDDNELFTIIYGNNKLINIRAEYTGSVLGTYASFLYLDIGSGSNIYNVQISNCNIKSTHVDKLPYFIYYDTGGSSNYLENFKIENCEVECVVSAIYIDLSQTAPKYSFISKNKFYQTSFISKSEACIEVGAESIISDNIIEGGYDRGIFIKEGAINTLINSNIIIGGTGVSGSVGSAIMKSGICTGVSTTSFNMFTSIKDNFIKGITDYGIDLRSGSSYPEECIIKGNVISNKFEAATLMTGIKSGGLNIIISENKIIYPGFAGIIYGSFVYDNEIIGNVSISTTTFGIQLFSGLSYTQVSNNYIENINGFGIDCQSNIGILINKNIMLGHPSSSFGIYDPGNYSSVAHNYIKGYTNSTTDSAIKVGGTISISIFNNILKDVLENGIDANAMSYGYITNNTILGSGASTKNAIFNIASNNIISNNSISALGNTLFYVIHTNSGGSSNIISENIIHSVDSHCPICLYVEGSSQTVINNIISSTPHQGIKTGDDCIVCNNNITGSASSTPGEHLLEVGNVSIISGNYIASSNDDGVCVGTNSIVSDNHITNSKGNGITSLGDSLIQNNNIQHSYDNGIETQGSFTSIINNLINVSANQGIRIVNVSADIDNIIILANKILTVTAGNGILFDTHSGTKHLVSHNYIKDVTTNLKAGISVTVGGSDSVFSGNYIINTKYGIDFSASSQTDVIISNNNIVDSLSNAINISSAITRCSIIENYINSPNGIGINHDGVSGYIASNYISDTTYNGITLSSSSDETQVVANRIENATTTGIDASGPDRLAIIANYVNGTASGENGIDLTGSSNTLLVGNYVDGNSAVSIKIDSSNTIVASGNFSNGGGTTPTGFTDTVNIDGYSCRHI